MENRLTEALHWVDWAWGVGIEWWDGGSGGVGLDSDNACRKLALITCGRVGRYSVLSMLDKHCSWR